MSTEHTHAPVSNRGRRRQRGVGAVEILVGVTIGMIAVVSIFQVVQLSERSKSTTSAVSSAQVDAAVLLYQLERDVLGAGLGTARLPRAAYGCRLAIDENGATRAPVPLAPLDVAFGADGSPDSITLFIAGEADAVDTVALTGSSGAESTLASAAGVRAPGGSTAGDVLVFARNDGSRCELRSVTSVATTGTPATPTGAVGHSGGRFRPVAEFAAGDIVMNVGRGVRSVTWSIGSSGRLELRDNLTGTSRVIASEVIDLQLMVGVDADDSNSIEAGEWRASGTLSAGDVGRILALRFGLLARADDYVRPDASGRPATPAAPAWSGGGFVMPAISSGIGGGGYRSQSRDRDHDDDRDDDDHHRGESDTSTETTSTGGAGDWRNYRYRVVETQTILRNMVWNR